MIRHGSGRKKRTVSHSTILTSSPYKAMLEGDKKRITPPKGPGKNKGKKTGNIVEKKMRKVNEKRNEEQNGKNIEKKRGKKIVEKKIKKKTTRKRKLSEIEEDEEDDTECLYCADLFSASAEGWISCQKCNLWAHNSCAGADDDQETFVCEICNDSDSD